ncbi:MAG: hypothetical protein L6Q40_04110 [Azonexus sp.]|nr:hypothetical protein [Azonexus sp.]
MTSGRWALTSKRRTQSGLFYLEALIAIVLLAILLVPAMQALSSSQLQTSAGLAERQLALRNLMEDVLRRPYEELEAATVGDNSSTSIKTAYSDASGAVNRRVVVFYRCNTTTNALTASYTGLVRVKVYYEADGANSGIETLSGKWW